MISVYVPSLDSVAAGAPEDDQSLFHPTNPRESSLEGSRKLIGLKGGQRAARGPVNNRRRARKDLEDDVFRAVFHFKINTKGCAMEHMNEKVSNAESNTLCVWPGWSLF